MKKFFFVLSFLLVSHSLAQSVLPQKLDSKPVNTPTSTPTAVIEKSASIVEHAMLTGYDDGTFAWQEPNEKNAVYSKTLDKLIPAMGCGENKLGWYSVFACAGSHGWEFIATDSTKTPVSYYKYWIFKRVK